MMVSPREGHLNALFHMFSFLKQRYNGMIVFDPPEPEIDESKFKREDRSATTYAECNEDLPSNVPEPLDAEFAMITFVDSDHAGDSITRRSRTGFVVFLSEAPIYWYSKKQTSCETPSFGAEG